MSSTEKVEQAARNNAFWCDAMCRAHGCPGEFREGGWLNFRRTPPFYPNAVTLGGIGQELLHRKLVQDVLQVGVSGEWGVKDSFHTLDLNPLGFHVLFESQWVYKAAAVIPEPYILEVSWDRVTTAAALNEWEEAWAGEADIRGMFVPDLLQNPDVAIVAARREGKIVAGCIANVGAECVGVSNIFLPTEQTQQFRRECMAKVQFLFPGLSLVGYESGADLVEMKEIGFEAIGELRVWVHESEG